MAYDVALEPLPMQAVFDLKGDRAALEAWCGAVLPAFPARPNSMTEDRGRLLSHVGPDRWLLRAEISEEEALLAELHGDAAGGPDTDHDH